VALPTVMHRDVEIGDVSIHYRQAGGADAAPVLLLHGGGSDGGTWEPMFAARRVCQALGLARTAVVGHSLGAYAACVLAQSHPGQVTKLVLEEPPAPNRVASSSPSAGLSRQRIPLLAAGSILRRRRYDPRAPVTAIGQLREPDPAWWTALASIAAPTLVISGGPRSHIAEHTLEQIVREIPQAELATIPVGHRVHSLATDRFATLVATFLAT
jgi:pimeloyl-ACP methyl ester carboxylesterase